MDLFSLLSGAQSNYKSFSSTQNISTKLQKNTKKQDLFIKVFQQNYQTIESFLHQKQIKQLRLICRGIGYLFIIRQLWNGIKNNVADKKLQDFDDYQFVQEQPKQISKQDKKIRIHSLKKKDTNITKKRQASNIKQKKMSMSIIQQQLHPFQKTQIGFKRLLKTNISKQSSILISQKSSHHHNNTSNYQQQHSIQRLIQLLQIPLQYSISDLLINPNDQFIKNIHRANNIISLLKKWNHFHLLFWTILSRQIQYKQQKFIQQQQQQNNNILTIIKKTIQINSCLLSYKTKTLQQQPYISIISMLSGAYKNTLIEEQLNKLGRQFMDNHKIFIQLIQSKSTEIIINQLNQLYQKYVANSKYNQNNGLESSVWVEGLNILDQTYQNIINKIKNQKIKSIYTKRIVYLIKTNINKHVHKPIKITQKNNIINNNSTISTNNSTNSLNNSTLYEQKIYSFTEINMKFIIDNSQLCQLVFEILYNLYGKFINSIDNIQFTISSNKNITKNNIININVNMNRLSFSKNNTQLQGKQQLSSSKGFTKLKSLNLNNNFTNSNMNNSTNNLLNNNNTTFKQHRTLLGILWNISKYFDKLQKQLILKQKKKKQQSKVILIKKFLLTQSSSIKENIVIYHKNDIEIKKTLNIIENYYKQFKVKIQQLKQEITKNDN